MKRLYLVFAIFTIGSGISLAEEDVNPFKGLSREDIRHLMAKSEINRNNQIINLLTKIHQISRAPLLNFREPINFLKFVNNGLENQGISFLDKTIKRTNTVGKWWITDIMMIRVIAFMVLCEAEKNAKLIDNQDTKDLINLMKDLIEAMQMGTIA